MNWLRDIRHLWLVYSVYKFIKKQVEILEKQSGKIKREKK